MLTTKILGIGVFLCAFFGTAYAHSENDIARVIAILEKYKTYLEEGTYVGFDHSQFKQMPKSRYYTFNVAFEHFARTGGKVVVELGTTRSFVHGGLPGCNSNDVRYWKPKKPQNWDWSAGCFTRTAAKCLAHLLPEIHTVDLEKSHIERCKIITASFKRILHYHVMSSVDFLKRCNFPKGIDLLTSTLFAIVPRVP